MIDGERLAAGEADVSFSEDIPKGLAVRADGEQLYRVLLNLVRNARAAIVASGRPGEIGVRADEDDETWRIIVTDTGPGLPPAGAREPVQGLPGRRHQGRLGPRPRHRGRDRAGPRRPAGAGADRPEAGTEFAIRLPKGAALARPGPCRAATRPRPRRRREARGPRPARHRRGARRGRPAGSARRGEGSAARPGRAGGCQARGARLHRPHSAARW